MSNSVTKGKLVKLAPMLPLAVVSAVANAHANEPQELAVTKAKAEQQQTYNAERSTSHKNTQSLADTPKSVSIITQDLMRDQGVDSLRDAMRNIAGISLAAGEGGAPTGDNLSIRGFSAQNDIFIDGMRDIAGYYRDIYNLEAIEVSKGPSSAQAGRGSTGGTITLSTKSAKLDNFNEVSARLGTESDYRLTLDTNIKLNDISAVRVNALVDDGDVAGRDYVNNSKTAVSVNAATGLGTATRLTINGEYQKQDNLPDYGLPWVPTSDKTYIDVLEPYKGKAPNVPYSNFYGNIYRDFEDIEAQVITAKLEHDLSANTLVRVQGRVGAVERQSVVTAPRFKDATKSANIRLDDEKTRDTENRMAALQADLMGRYFTAGIQHDLVAGIELANEKFERWNFVSTTDNLISDGVTNDLFNPQQHAYTGKYHREGNSTLAEGKSIALYVIDTLTLDPQWQLTLGLRHDSFDVDYHYDYVDSAKVLTSDISEFSWNSALVYKANQDTNWYLAAGNSFNPSAEGLTFSTSTGSNLDELDPEQTTSYEFGVKQQWFDDVLSTSVALFQITKDNARTRELDGSYTLHGEQRVKGIEFAATGKVSRNFDIVTSLSLQDSEVLSASEREAATIGSELPRTPKVSASLWGRYQATDKLAIGLGANYIGKRYNSSDAVTRRVAEGYTLVNMMVTYQVNADLDVQLNATNLFDKEYIDQLGGGHFIPGEGRYIGLSANYRF
ncbi:TonB-dependent receptor [Pseudoalteromonas fenneropenaei]|uniref:TonB-dependent receptor n=1 Tax=Pseudoalteromonas fenneropenaei TaxID=1737459 RepID=A0ABV7CGG1_9GAMM